MVPDLAAHGGNGIAECAVSLWVPGSGRGKQRGVGGEVMRPESNQREQAEQRRGGAHNRQIGPLTLSFDAEMGTDLLKCDLQLPTRDEPLEDVDGSRIEAGAEEDLRRQFADRIAHEQPSNGHNGRAAAIPNGGTGGDLDDTIAAAVPKSDRVALPNRAGIVQHLGQRGQALALDRRSSAARSSGWCGRIEIGVEAQSGDDTDIASDGAEEIDGGECRVADDDNLTAWQPAMDLQCDLAGPIQQRLG